MALTREERKLLHQKSRQPTFGANKPDNTEGFEGDISFRQVQGSGTVQYLKEDGNWKPISSSGDMPPVRIGQGGGKSIISTSGGATDHGDLTSLIGYDHHTQYLLIDGTRAMTGDLTINGGDIIYGNAQNATISVTPTAHNVAGKLLTITSSHTTAGTTNNIAGGSLKFEAGQGKGSGAGGNIVFATANAGSSGSTLNALAVALTISDDLSSTFTGDVSVGDDLFLTSSGSIVNWNSGDVTLTHAAGKLTFGGDGAVELDFNNHEMTNVDIDSGAIDGTAIGAASHSTIKGTTIDATTDFTIDGIVITADTISNDQDLTVDVGRDLILDANSGEFRFFLAGDDNDYAKLNVAANGVTTLSTHDDGGTVGHLTLDADGDLILDAHSGITKFYLAGDTDDLCTLTVAANGATTIATTDSSGITGHLTLDADGDIILDAAGDDIYFKDAGSERFRMDLNGTPTLAVTGAFTIDGSATVTIDGTTGVNIQEGGTNVINIDTDKYIYFHAYAQSLAEDYALNNKAVLYHFTTGNADYKENYTFLSYYHVPDNSGTDLYEAYPS